MHIHQIAEDSELLKQERHDPITGEKLKAGDEIVFCAGCKSAFFKDTWAYLEGEHCGQNDTLSEFPKQETLKFTYEQIDVSSFELEELLFDLRSNTNSFAKWTEGSTFLLETWRYVFKRNAEQPSFLKRLGKGTLRLLRSFVEHKSKVENLMNLLTWIALPFLIALMARSREALKILIPGIYLAPIGLLIISALFIITFAMIPVTLIDLYQSVSHTKTRFWSLHQNGIYMGGQRPNSYLPLKNSNWKLRFSDISIIRVWQEKRRTKLEVVLKDRRRQQIKVPRGSKKALFWALKRVSRIIRVEFMLQDRQDLSYVRVMRGRHGAEFDIVHQHR
ncbi:MAG: hypothetical protein AAF740_08585 [Bacteroidota bacterium]